MALLSALFNWITIIYYAYRLAPALYAASKQEQLLLFFLFPFCAASNRGRLLIKDGLYSKKHGTYLICASKLIAFASFLSGTGQLKFCPGIQH